MKEIQIPHVIGVYGKLISLSLKIHVRQEQKH